MKFYYSEREKDKMQENIANKTAEAIRLVKWLSEHPKIQSRLFEDYAETTPEECLEIIEMLEKNEFYEMEFFTNNYGNL
jgi:hypothetical protein